MAADGPADRELRPDGGAQALPRRGHLRRDSTRRRNEKLADHSRDQQGCRSAYIRHRRLRHRRRPVRDCSRAHRRDKEDQRRVERAAMTAERETLEMDVLLVGAGPANLACALHLSNLIGSHNEKAKLSGAKGLDEVNIAVIEKAAEIGAHQLSGAVLDPISLRELIPDFEKDAPFEAPVGEERVYFLTERGKLGAPIIPPPLRNHGNYVVSINKLVRWLAEKCEAA